MENEQEKYPKWSLIGPQCKFGDHFGYKKVNL